MQAWQLGARGGGVEAADGVFHHHHRRVHQHADGNGQAAQAHQIGAHACQAHQQERAQCRQGHHQGHHQGGAQFAQKQQQQHDDQRRGFQQRAFYGAYGTGNQRAAVVKRHHLHARRQAGGQLIQAGANGLHQGGGIGTAQRHHNALHGFAGAIAADGAVARQALGAHTGYIAQQGGRGCGGARAQHHLRQIL